MPVLVAAVASSRRCGHEFVSPSSREAVASNGVVHESVAVAERTVGTETCTGHAAFVAHVAWAAVDGGLKSRRNSGRLRFVAVE